MLRLIPILLLSLTSIAAFAQSESPSSPDQYPGWIVSVGYAMAPNPFVGKASDASQAFPTVGYDERLTRTMGPTLLAPAAMCRW